MSTLSGSMAGFGLGWSFRRARLEGPSTTGVVSSTLLWVVLVLRRLVAMSAGEEAVRSMKELVEELVVVAVRRWSLGGERWDRCED